MITTNDPIPSWASHSVYYWSNKKRSWINALHTYSEERALEHQHMLEYMQGVPAHVVHWVKLANEDWDQFVRLHL